MSIPSASMLNASIINNYTKVDYPKIGRATKLVSRLTSMKNQGKDVNRSLFKAKDLLLRMLDRVESSLRIDKSAINRFDFPA